MNYIICEETSGYAEYPIVESCRIGTMEFTMRNHTLYMQDTEISEGKWVDMQNCRMLFLGEVKAYYERVGEIFISGDSDQICIPDSGARIVIGTSAVHVYDCGSTSLYLNREKIGVGEYPIEAGDVLLIDYIKCVVGETTLTLIGTGYTCNLPIVCQSAVEREDFPRYKRSPRIIKRISENKIKIEPFPKMPTKGKQEFLKTILPPLGMLAITVGVGLVLKRGIYMLMSVSATVMTTVLSAVKMLQDRKESSQTGRVQTEQYEKYLLQKQKEIYRQWISEKEAYDYNYPSLKEMEEMIDRCDSRIYERSSLDDDFLTFSLGNFWAAASFSIQDTEREFEVDNTPFKNEIRQLKKNYSMIHKPQVLDLKKGNLGLVGEKSIVHEQLKIIVGQLVFAQSYHDLQFIMVYDEMYEEEFRWIRWLSHAKLQSLNVLGLIHSQKTRDQVMSSLQQILKERKQKLEEDKKESRFLPHYVFIIDEPRLLMDHSIMEFLGGNEGSRLGFSVIYTTHQRANLPDNIDTVLLLENSTEGRLLLLERELLERRIELSHVNNVNLEWMARNLGVLVHEQGMTSHIPESITFFDMYGVRNPEELRIAFRWQTNNSSKTLAVPLGAKAENDILELNLHEKAHGPHGLVAGTTGSGKSEILQSYILSLAVNFHPYEVGFLLIDYKGGGMANLFKDLPHLLGVITNLDGSESMRALASIKAEIGRRERIFGDVGVNNINAYTELFKEGKTKEPLPHLFIISDEFAELKREQPEFMKELISVARVGRSIGIHLILATQKPTGVVDDQIWANSRFKLCLKVQNEADSKEILKTPDAANITHAGQAFLQVGNNEIYELFQSAWSGAKYVKETEKEVTQDNRVYLVNELGQGELINKDLRESKEEQRARDTQLSITIRHIKQLYDSMDTVPVRKPWLPSLPSKLINPSMSVDLSDRLDLSILVGKRDVPEAQMQTDYAIDLARQGNVLYVASSGYGKTVFLENAALHLAAKNSVKNLIFYALDFGNNALISLAKLPHMAAHIMLDDEEKFKKFLKILSDEIKSRKKKLAAVLAQNFLVYNEMAEYPMAAIVILIDNFDAIREMDFEMENYFTKATRDGTGLGIYFLATASRSNAVRAATLNNFKNKIAGVNFDASEARGLVGRCNYSLPDIVGRSLVKVEDNVNIMQLFSPVPFVDEVDFTNHIRELTAEIAQASPEEAEHIPILPEEYDFSRLLSYRQGTGEISLGLEWENVYRVGFRWTQSPFLILGESGTGKTNALKVILNQMDCPEHTYLFDSRARGLYDYRDKGHYITSQQGVEDFANFLAEETKNRKAYLDAELEKGVGMVQACESLTRLYVIIDDLDDFIELTGAANMLVAAGRFKKSMEYAISYIVTANVSKFNSQDEFTKSIKGTKNGLLVSGQGFMTIFPIRGDVTPRQPDACLMLDGRSIQIRMPKAD